MKNICLALSCVLSAAAVRAEIPAETDVLVVGGTVGGVAAAVAAKKAGARVYLVAPRPFLGEDLAGRLDLLEPERALGKKGREERLPPICRDIYDEKGHDGAAFCGDTTPAQIKRALDHALLKAHVPFLTWTIGCEILKDAEGRAAGVLVASRSGTRVIRAKAVVDATVRGELVRRANGAGDPVRPGDYAFTRYLVSGAAPTSSVVRTTSLGAPVEIPAGARGPHQAASQPRTIAAQPTPWAAIIWCRISCLPRGPCSASSQTKSYPAKPAISETMGSPMLMKTPFTSFPAFIFSFSASTLLLTLILLTPYRF